MHYAPRHVRCRVGKYLFLATQTLEVVLQAACVCGRARIALCSGQQGACAYCASGVWWCCYTIDDTVLRSRATGGAV